MSAATMAERGHGVSRRKGTERERLATRETEREGEALKVCDGMMGASESVWCAGCVCGSVDSSG